MVAGAPNLRSPPAVSAHPFRVQHVDSHSPYLGYELPPLNQSPAQWWGPWGSLIHGPNTINSGHLCLLWQFRVITTMHLTSNNQHINNGRIILYRPINPQWPATIQAAKIRQINNMTSKINHLQTLW